MTRKFRCAKFTIIVFAVLEIIGALVAVGLGAASLIKLDDISQYYIEQHANNNQNGTTVPDEPLKNIISIISIACIAVGILSISNALIGIAAAIKEHSCLLVLHIAMLGIGVLGACVLPLYKINLQTVIILIVATLRLGLTIYLLNLLKIKVVEESHHNKESAV